MFLLVFGGSPGGWCQNRPFIAEKSLSGNTDYTVEVWNSDNGLPQNTVNEIVQAPDGYLWIATNDGLVRFDGVRFTVYRTSNSPGLPSNRIVKLKFDPSGVLWAATENSYLVSYSGGSFRSFRIPEGSFFISDILFTRKGEFLVACINGSLYQFINNSFVPYITDPLFHNDGLRLHEDRQEGLLITCDVIKGIKGYYSYKNGKIRHIMEPDALVYGMVRRPSGELVINTDKGIYQQEHGTLKHLFPENKVETFPPGHLFVDRENNIWLSIQGKCLTVIRDKQVTCIKTDNGLSSSMIRSIMQDAEGNIWIGTNEGGMNKINRKDFRVISKDDGLIADIVCPVMQSRDGAIWVGNTCGGLNRIQDGQITHFVNQNKLGGCIWSLMEDKEGNIWTGFWGGGLSCLRKDRVDRYDQKDGLASDVVLSLFQDRQGTIWAGTSLGLQKMSNNRFITPDLHYGLLKSTTVCILQDSKGRTWTGTTDGAGWFGPGGSMVYNQKNGLSNNNVRAIYEDPAGAFWIGTYGGGLNRLKDGKIRKITSADGLYDDVVSCILVDEKMNFWMTCNKGVYMIPWEELNECADGKIARISCLAFGREAGLRSNECNGGFQPSGLKATDGTFWFPTLKGIAGIKPGEFLMKQPIPRVVIEELVAESQIITDLRNIRIPYGSGRLLINYAALVFTNPQNVSFSYKLDGYDQNWVEGRQERRAVYTKLPPGIYTFRVKAYLPGIVQDNETLLRFEILTPFYMTTWFKILVGVVLIIVIWLLIWKRIRAVHARNLWLKEEVSRRTQELETINARLVELNQELLDSEARLREANLSKDKFFSIIAHDLRSPFTALIGFSELLHENFDQFSSREVRSFAGEINRTAQMVFQLLENLLQWSRLQTGRIEMVPAPFEISRTIGELIDLFKASAAKNEIRIDFIKTGRSEVFGDENMINTAIRNILSNALKFTPRGGLITITMKQEGNLLEVVVADTGIGIKPELLPDLFRIDVQVSTTGLNEEKGTGLGLVLAKEFIEKNGGKIWIESTPGQGTKVLMTIPVHKQMN